MQILRKHKLNIRKSYLYIAALFISSIVLLQMSNMNGINSFQGVLRYAVLFITNYLVWAFLIDYIYGAIHPFQEKERKVSTAFLEAIISLLLLLVFHVIITNLIYYGYLLIVTDLQLREVFDDFKPFLLKSIASRLLDLFIIIVLMKIMTVYTALQKKKLQVVSLENQLHLSQLEALRAQLDPHFLFNTLHTLNTLIGYDNEKARSMIIKVTHLLRKILDQRGKHLISFEEELDYFRSYLDIEQERFHDRLKVSFDVNEETKPIEVPALILQPLIENAFKHGISLIEGEGRINLSAKIDNNKMIVVLKNSTPKVTQKPLIPSNKLGLSNLRDRLKQVFGSEYEFLVNKEEDMFITTLIINLKK